MNASLSLTPFHHPMGLSPIGSLQAYIQAVRTLPMLSQFEEQALARRFLDDGDLEAARQLVLAHLRFVVRIARGYNGYGLNQSDLIQEGNVGLMKAVKRFDPGYGVRLASFAVHWIRAEIHEFILRNWRIVRMATTKAQRKLFFNLRKARTHLGWLKDEEAHAVAADLGVPVHEVYAMEERLAHHDLAFDGSPAEGEDTPQPAHQLGDVRYDPARLIEQDDSATSQTEQLEQALGALDDRTREILRRRWLAESKATLHELAQDLGISAERVRQIEAKGLQQLRVSLTPS